VQAAAFDDQTARVSPYLGRTPWPRDAPSPDTPVPGHGFVIGSPIVDASAGPVCCCRPCTVSCEQFTWAIASFLPPAGRQPNGRLSVFKERNSGTGKTSYGLQDFGFGAVSAAIGTPGHCDHRFRTKPAQLRPRRSRNRRHVRRAL
jgi:hypothetical protein